MEQSNILSRTLPFCDRIRRHKNTNRKRANLLTKEGKQAVKVEMPEAWENRSPWDKG